MRVAGVSKSLSLVDVWGNSNSKGGSVPLGSAVCELVEAIPEVIIDAFANCLFTSKIFFCLFLSASSKRLLPKPAFWEFRVILGLLPGLAKLVMFDNYARYSLDWIFTKLTRVFSAHTEKGSFRQSFKNRNPLAVGSR